MPVRLDKLSFWLIMFIGTLAILFSIGYTIGAVIRLPFVVLALYVPGYYVPSQLIATLIGTLAIPTYTLVRFFRKPDNIHYSDDGPGW